MSQRHELARHRQKLAEAREVMNSMKSLAFMETRKLAQFLVSQREVVATLKEVAADFLRFHQPPEAYTATGPAVYLLIGSERGFCGAFNEALVDQLETERDAQEAELILCGHKLCALLEDDRRILHRVEGVSVVDEAGTLLVRVSTLLADLNLQRGPILLRVIYQDDEQQSVRVDQLLPPFLPAPAEGSDNNTLQSQVPPELHLEPREFFSELVEHYLFALLHEVIFVSLMSEYRRRTQHLDGAVRYLDERLEAMQRRDNQLRQEEITEEIEVLLLNAAGAEPPADT
ncbi:F0F1 ATP synthase subunit gamma [Marinobacterium lutimaris]|uniref:F-type H+-transporting ATPase subunit gamma n=1 Tax=Marinobacterium lutimaris TaxID=568106 RepID=A0A1H5X6V3_9GAMM|nr:FoF1 ATP synthase subunit gamma [Marinobacterium lutimaris]SEG07479.1 F-type H+-transporting ATPase subunit gamma [Marinobacterium lutimaris]